MDIVVLLLALVLAFLLAPRLALAIVAVVWLIALVLVGWGPAHSSGTHTGTVGFWVPWLVVLAIGCAIVLGIDWNRRRRGGAPRFGRRSQPAD